MLRDSFGRSFPYIRLSITDVCNFKCGYCLPNGYQVDKSDNRKFLHLEEIRRLAKVFSKLGVCKIRLTGGEPTVRKDFFDIIKILKNEAGIKKVVITTNGYHLDEKARMLVDSGLNGINISIDSLDRNTFKNVTGHDRLPEILKGINILHVSSKIFKEYLNKNNWIYQTLGKDAGPSLNYINPEYKGKFGIIAPYSKDFCRSCNRLRITSRGDLRLCLFGNTGISIRHLLQKDDQIEELQDLIMGQMKFKKESHHLELGETGLTKNLSNTGG